MLAEQRDTSNRVSILVDTAARSGISSGRLARSYSWLAFVEQAHQWQNLSGALTLEFLNSTNLPSIYPLIELILGPRF